MGAESRIRVGMTSSTLGEGDMSARKRDIRSLADASAPERRNWLARPAFFHQEDLRHLQFLLPQAPPLLGPAGRARALLPPPQPPALRRRGLSPRRDAPGRQT